MADPIAGLVGAIPTIPASELRTLFNYNEPFSYKPHTTDIAGLKFEIDDIQVLRYLVRNAQPQRYLEFGTWEGLSALACLEECDAAVWTINLLEGERNKDGSFVYGRTYLGDQSDAADGEYVVVGTDELHGGVIRSFQTDSFEFIGRRFREAGLSHRVCQIYGDSRSWDATSYPADFFDTVFIDGGHDPETVVNDTRKALSRLRPGGLVIWHDFCPAPSVYENAESSAHGVISGLAEIWDEVEEQLTTFCWVENTWMLVGMRAGDPASGASASRAVPGPAKGGSATDRRVQSASLQSGIAALQRELGGYAKFREERDTLNDELMRLRSENAGLERRLSRHASMAHERDLLLARNEDLITNSKERDALRITATELRSQVSALEQRVSAYGQLMLERDAYADQAEQLTKEQTALRARLEAADGRYEELVSARDNLVSQLIDSQNRETEAQRSETETQALSVQAASERSVEQDEFDGLKEELETRIQESAAANADCGRLETELAASRREVEAANGERARLEAELAAGVDRIARLETQEVDRARAVEAQLLELNEIRLGIAEREGTIATLESESHNLSGQLDAQKEALLGHNRQSESLTAEVAALNATNRALEERQAELHDSHDSLRERNEALLRDNVTREGQLDQARAEAEIRTRENAALEARIGDLGRTLRELETVRRDLDQALADRKSEIEALSESVREREQTIATRDEEIVALNEILGKNERLSGDLKHDLASTRTALDQVQQSRRGLVADLAARKTELATLSTLIEEQSAALTETGRRVSTVTAERDRLAGRVSDAGKKLQNAETENRSLETDNIQKAAELTGRIRDASDLTGERDGLAGRLSDAGKQLQNAETENRSLEANSLQITAELTGRIREVSDLTGERDILQTDIENHKRSLAHFDRVMTDIRRENEQLRIAIDDYTSSHSWRITAPLRMVTGLFRR